MTFQQGEMKRSRGWALLAFILVFGLLAVLRGQPQDWDLLDYHFYNGFAFLNWRYFHDLSPAMIQTHLNPFFDVMNYVMISTLPAVVAVFAQGAITGGSVYLLYRMALELLTNAPQAHRRGYALAAAVIGGTGVATLMTLSLMSNDNKTGLMVMISLYAFMRGLLVADERLRRRWVAAAGGVVGLAMAFKLVAACYVGGFGVALLFCRRLTRQHFILCVIYGLAALGGFALGNGFWMVYWQTHYGNPFFPYYNDIFRSPFVAADSYKDGNFVPSRFWMVPYDWAFKKKNPLSEAILDVRPLALCVLAVAALAMAAVRRVKGAALREEGQTKIFWRFLVLWFLASFVFWHQVFSIHRYLIPLELTMGLFIVFLVCRIIQGQRLRVAALVVLVILFGATSRLLGKGLMAFSFTAEDLTRKMFVVEPPPAIPENAVVLLTNEAPVAYLIPFFPQGVRFIGLPFAFSKKYDGEPQTIFARKALKMMEEAGDSLYVLKGEDPLLLEGSANKPLQDLFAGHNLEIKGRCEPVKSNIAPDWLGDISLCRIGKKPLS